MRKIESHNENPIDNILIGIGEQLSPGLYKTGHTPNIITAYSFIVGLMSLHALYYDQNVKFSILFFISYFFDCIDGFFARKYKMTSRFGDLFDHVTDVTVGTGIFVILTYKFFIKRKFPTPFQIGLLFFLALLIYLALTHLGCQQHHYSNDDREDETLDSAKGLCPTKEHIDFYRYFGTGTLVFAISVIIGLKLLP